jgi:hypothetical protein
MPILKDYHQFDGLNWETGTIRNALDYQGVKAPHTGKPYSEALLFGVSGGIIAGYFPFEYAGLDPWLHFITRNTLEPMQRLIERMGIQTQVKQTDKADKAVKNLTDALEAGKPAIVWADAFTLPYNNLKGGKDEWGIFPVLVYGYDDTAVHIADRPKVPLSVTPEIFAKARARTATNKHRLMTIDAPDHDRLLSAVEAGILACAAYMLDEPPLKPMKGKFGLDAFTRWADVLVSTKKDGWAKAYPGVKLYSILMSGYRYINLWGSGGDGSRGQYADFLDEAAVILGQPALKRVAESYREAVKCWDELNAGLLPDTIAPFKETRELLDRQYELFMTRGGDALEERAQMDTRLQAIRDSIAREFPLTEAETTALREDLRTRVLAVQEAEKTAALALRRAMG